MTKEISIQVNRRCCRSPITRRYMVALTNVEPTLVFREVSTTSGVETSLEPSMLCLLRRSMT